MRVLVTGGTGFVGRAVIRALVKADHEVVALVRAGSEEKLPRGVKVETAPGDVSDRVSLADAAKGCRAMVHLVGIIREFPGKGITFQKLHYEATVNALAAAKAAGVRRYVHMSALGARPDSTSPYHRTKAAAEAEVKASGLDWTIFRPSLIFGPRDQSINLFVDQLRKAPVYPIIGDGEYRIAPVSLTTVARAFALALDDRATIGRSFEPVGPETYSFNQLVDLLADIVGRKPTIIHIPVPVMRFIAGLLGRFAWFPLTRPQIDMLLEGSSGSGREFYDAFPVEPIDLAAGLKTYLEDLS